MIQLADCFVLQRPLDTDSDAHFNPPAARQKRARSTTSTAQRKRDRGTDGFTDVILTLEERVDLSLADRILQRLDVDSSQYKELRKYRDAYGASSTLSVNYHRKDYNIGRLYPRPHISLGVMQRALRGALCGNMFDVDMENAHPTFLLKEAETRGWRCARLREYVEDRERVLAHISDDRTAAKVAVLSLINNGSLKPAHENVAYLRELHAELRGIRDGIWETHTEIRKLVESGSRSNPRASATSFFMADREQRALLCVAEAFQSRGWEVATLVYDGLMVYKNPEKSIDTDLPLVEADLEVHCGANVKLSIKPWDSSLLEGGI